MVIAGATGLRGSVSVSSGQLLVFKITFFILTAAAIIGLITVGALLFAVPTFSAGGPKSQTVANGSIYMSALAMVIVLNVAVIFPALLLLQPFRLWRVRRAEKEAVTPRQTFRGELACIFFPTKNN
jgi:nitric oxide reductase large subunit